MTSARKASGKEKDFKFEEAVDRLEAIVEKLEGSDVPLEEALGLFEEGVRLSKACHKKLAEAEKKVQILLEDDEGNLKAQPFEEDDEEEDEAPEDEGEVPF